MLEQIWHIGLSLWAYSFFGMRESRLMTPALRVMITAIASVSGRKCTQHGYCVHDAERPIAVILSSGIAGCILYLLRLHSVPLLLLQWVSGAYQTMTGLSSSALANRMLQANALHYVISIMIVIGLLLLMMAWSLLTKVRQTKVNMCKPREEAT